MVLNGCSANFLKTVCYVMKIAPVVEDHQSLTENTAVITILLDDTKFRKKWMPNQGKGHVRDLVSAAPFQQYPRNMAATRVFNHVLHRRHAILYNVSSTCSLYNSNVRLNLVQTAFYCTKKSVSRVDVNESKNKLQTGLGEVVKENTKSTMYLAVILGGVGVTIMMFYGILSELFSSKSPNGVYSKALKDCMKHPKVVDMLGEPIKAYGEESRRGRRTHIGHTTFLKEGVPHMRMKFYIQGIRRRGTVTLEVQESESGDYVYRYLYVIVDDVARSIIKIEDNRGGATSHVTELEFS